MKKESLNMILSIFLYAYTTTYHGRDFFSSFFPSTFAHTYLILQLFPDGY